MALPRLLPNPPCLGPDRFESTSAIHTLRPPLSHRNTSAPSRRAGSRTVSPSRRDRTCRFAPKSKAAARYGCHQCIEHGGPLGAVPSPGCDGPDDGVLPTVRRNGRRGAGVLESDARPCLQDELSALDGVITVERARLLLSGTGRRGGPTAPSCHGQILQRCAERRFRALPVAGTPRRSRGVPVFLLGW